MFKAEIHGKNDEDLSPFFDLLWRCKLKKWKFMSIYFQNSIL